MGCGIYLITCTSNNKKYVGSSINIDARWRSHRSKLKNNKHTPLLQNIYRKYGIESLQFSVLELCDEKSLIEREQYWYESLKNNGNTMLNYSDIVENSTRGVPLSDERKKYLSEKLKGKPNVNKGKKMPKSFGEKISSTLKSKGYKMTQKNKEILRQYITRPRTQEEKMQSSIIAKMVRGVKIICIDTGEIFDSYTDAAKKYNTSYQNVRQSIIHKTRCKKMKFELLKTIKNE